MLVKLQQLISSSILATVLGVLTVPNSLAQTPTLKESPNSAASEAPVKLAPTIPTQPKESPNSAPPRAPVELAPTIPTQPIEGTPYPPVPEAPVMSAPTKPVLPNQVESAYMLGAGDVIRMDIFETPELLLENRYTVLVDGTLNLPWVGSIPVQGLNLRQAARAISARYREYIRNPLITVTLTAPRPLKIGVIGEVNRPGSYIISVIGSETSVASLNRQQGGGEIGNQWPTVSRALQTAGGITQKANIRQIQVRRPLPDGTQDVINVDLWKFLQEGDLAQDLLLRDGDTIALAIAPTIDPAEATQVAVSNFSPELIKVNVVGEVTSPGAVAIRPNSTLNQAIFAAGGLKNERARKKRVELVRLNPDGTVTRKVIDLDFSKGLEDASNPAVQNNDVVIVNRNTLATISDTLSAFTSPITGVFGVLSILGIR